MVDDETALAFSLSIMLVGWCVQRTGELTAWAHDRVARENTVSVRFGRYRFQVPLFKPSIRALNPLNAPFKLTAWAHDRVARENTVSVRFGRYRFQVPLFKPSIRALNPLKRLVVGFV